MTDYRLIKSKKTMRYTYGHYLYLFYWRFYSLEKYMKIWFNGFSNLKKKPDFSGLTFLSKIRQLLLRLFCLRPLH